MFGLGFLNSAFLFALGAIALPVVIHLLNRRRIKKIPFSTVEFLYELSKRRMRKINLRRLLILILRALAVLFLVLAFARPTLRSTAALFLPGTAPKSVVIGLDASYSMGVEWEVGTAFTRAKELAAQVVDECGPEDLLNVIVFSSRADAMFENGTRNRPMVKKAIEKTELLYERTGYDRVMAKAYDLVARSGLEHGEVYIVSDFRETGDSILVPEPPPGVRVMLLPVYEEAVDNVSIDRVFVPRKLIRPGEVVQVGAVVSNHSRQNPADFPLELIVDGKRKAEQVIRLEPAATATVNFSIAFNRWGMYRGVISKSADRLNCDDERFFLLDVSRSLPVTLVRGIRQSPEAGGPASYFYVQRALNPRRSGDGEFSVKVVDEHVLTVSDLPAKGVVVWTDPQAQPGDRRLRLLKRFVQGGGAMMIFLGESSPGVRANKTFTDFIGIAGTSRKQAAQGERLISFQKDHPIFAIFDSDELELLSRASIRNYQAVRGVAPDSVIAYLSNGDPAMWECSRGEGKIIVFTLAPDMGGGDLPLSPMFLPLVHTSVSYLASAERAGRPREHYVGAELFFDLPEPVASSDRPLIFQDDAGARITPALFDNPQGAKMVILQRPSRPGFYKLLADTMVVSEVAVNLDTRESDLSARQLDRQVIGNASVVGTGQAFADDLRRAREGREIFAVFLLLAAAALVSEALLGRRA